MCGHEVEIKRDPLRTHLTDSSMKSVKGFKLGGTKVRVSSLQMEKRSYSILTPYSSIRIFMSFDVW